MPFGTVASSSAASASTFTLPAINPNDRKTPPSFLLSGTRPRSLSNPPPLARLKDENEGVASAETPTYSNSSKKLIPPRNRERDRERAKERERKDLNSRSSMEGTSLPGLGSSRVSSACSSVSTSLQNSPDTFSHGPSLTTTTFSSSSTVLLSSTSTSSPGSDAPAAARRTSQLGSATKKVKKRASISSSSSSSPSSTHTSSTSASSSSASSSASAGIICYRYCIGKGNNSLVIRQLFRSRPCWWPLNEPTDGSLNLLWTEWKNRESFPELRASHSSFPPTPAVARGLRVVNHFEQNNVLTSKRGMYQTLRKFYSQTGQDLFAAVPITFHLRKGVQDGEYQRFLQTYERLEKERGEAGLVVEEEPKKGKKGKGESGKEKAASSSSSSSASSSSSSSSTQNIWIVKPGDNTNKGMGIELASDLQAVLRIIESSSRRSSFVVQKYIERPLLIHRRKFDIRMYLLLSNTTGHMRAHLYREGYLRTSVKEYTLSLENKLVHLTNDAVQKKSELYGKHEPGNKMSFVEFQRYLDAHHAEAGVSVENDIYSQIKALSVDTIRAAYNKIDPNNRKYCFEIFGYDFMVDADFKVWLIEINTNPCLELASPYLSHLIPTMLDSAFRTVLDPMFPVPDRPHKKHKDGDGGSKEAVFHNHFELIFDQTTDPFASSQSSSSSDRNEDSELSDEGDGVEL